MAIANLNSNQNLNSTVNSTYGTVQTKKRKAIVKVNVLNQEYKIATDGSSDRALKVAKYLDQAVREILKKAPNTQSFNALVLAAMNITDKYLSASENHTRFKVEVGQNTKKIFDLLEDATKFENSKSKK